MTAAWKRIPANHSAILFEPNGSVSVLMPPKEQDSVVDMGTHNALRAAMLFGDSEASIYLRELVDEMIEVMAGHKGHG